MDNLKDLKKSIAENSLIMEELRVAQHLTYDYNTDIELLSEILSNDKQQLITFIEYTINSFKKEGKTLKDFSEEIKKVGFERDESAWSRHANGGYTRIETIREAAYYCLLFRKSVHYNQSITVSRERLEIAESSIEQLKEEQINYYQTTRKKPISHTLVIHSGDKESLSLVKKFFFRYPPNHSNIFIEECSVEKTSPNEMRELLSKSDHLIVIYTQTLHNSKKHLEEIIQWAKHYQNAPIVNIDYYKGHNVLDTFNITKIPRDKGEFALSFLLFQATRRTKRFISRSKILLATSLILFSALIILSILLFNSNNKAVKAKRSVSILENKIDLLERQKSILLSEILEIQSNSIFSQFDSLSTNIWVNHKNKLLQIANIYPTINKDIYLDTLNAIPINAPSVANCSFNNEALVLFQKQDSSFYGLDKTGNPINLRSCGFNEKFFQNTNMLNRTAILCFSKTSKNVTPGNTLTLCIDIFNSTYKREVFLNKSMLRKMKIIIDDIDQNIFWYKQMKFSPPYKLENEYIIPSSIKD